MVHRRRDLRESFYDERVYLDGEAAKDISVYLFRHGAEFVGMWSFEREVVAGGAVKRVYEAVYAKVLVPESELMRPDPANLTPGTRALFELLFPG